MKNAMTKTAVDVSPRENCLNENNAAAYMY